MEILGPCRVRGLPLLPDPDSQPEVAVARLLTFLPVILHNFGNSISLLV